MSEKILLVDDEDLVLQSFKRRLSGSFDIETATSPLSALERIRNDGPYGAVVSDLVMPELNGIELLKMVKAISPDTGRIMLTGEGDLQTIIDAINESGIDLYIEKPASSEKLHLFLDQVLKEYKTKLSARRSLQTLNEEIAKRRARQLKLSNHDPSTGLSNRHYSMQSLRAWHEAMTLRQKSEALIIIRIDNFLSLSTGKESECVEELLNVLDDRLRLHSNHGDIISRWDNDSYIMTANYAAQYGSADEFLNNLIVSLNEPYEFNGSDVPFTISTGVAFSLLDAPDLAGLIRCAEQAMSMTITKGPRSIAIYNPNTFSSSVDSCLIDKSSSNLLFQPIISIHSGKILGAKAILRPFDQDECVTGVETSGMSKTSVDGSVRDGLRLIDEVCKALASWQSRGIRLSISFKVSSALLCRLKYIKKIQKFIIEYNIEAKFLEFELSALERISNSPIIMRNLQDLRTFGVRVSLSEFCPGLTAEESLPTQMIDKIKFSKETIRQLSYNANMDTFLNWVVSLSNEQGIDIVWSGVDRKKHLDIIQKYGGSYEGLLISGPVTEHQFYRLIGQT